MTIDHTVEPEVDPEEDTNPTELHHTIPVAEVPPYVWDQNREWKKRPEDLEEILLYHPDIPRLRLNELTYDVECNGNPLRDTDETKLQILISQTCSVIFPAEQIRAIIPVVAETNAYHPIKDYLAAIAWDGKDRFDELLRCLHPVCDDKEHYDFCLVMLTKYIISMIARIFDPGCKADSMLVLKGLTGIRKSELFKILVRKPQWFSDSMIDIGDKDAYVALLGLWLYEFAEFYGINKKDQNSIKSFITSQVDRFRPPYGRKSRTFPRQVVLAGTTNDDDFLRDPTSTRRYMPIECSDQEIDTDKASLIMDQVLAHALHLFKQGETHHLNFEQTQKLDEYNERFKPVDVWEHEIREFVANLNQTKVKDILTTLGFKNVTSFKKTDEMRVASILRKIGFKKAESKVNNKTTHYWIRKEPILIAFEVVDADQMELMGKFRVPDEQFRVIN